MAFASSFTPASSHIPKMVRSPRALILTDERSEAVFAKLAPLSGFRHTLAGSNDIALEELEAANKEDDPYDLVIFQDTMPLTRKSADPQKDAGLRFLQACKEKGLLNRTLHVHHVLTRAPLTKPEAYAFLGDRWKNEMCFHNAIENYTTQITTEIFQPMLAAINSRYL